MATPTRIFISYRRESIPYVAALIRKRLLAEDYDVVLDAADLSLNPFKQTIEHRIQQYNCLVLILERATFTSEWVQNEIIRALNEDVGCIVMVGCDGLLPPVLNIPQNQSDNLKYYWTKYDDSSSDADLNEIVSAVSFCTSSTRKKDLPRVKDLMDISVHMIEPNRTLDEAQMIMEKHSTTYLVVAPNPTSPLTGWLSKGEVIKCMPSLNYRLARVTTQDYNAIVKARLGKSVSTRMIHRHNQRRPLQWLLPDLTILEAIEKFVEIYDYEGTRFRIRHFPVLDTNGVAVGVLGYWMIIDYCSKIGMIPKLPIEDIMIPVPSDEFVHIEEQNTVLNVYRQARTQGWSHIAIENSDHTKLVGMTTIEKISQMVDNEVNLSHLPVSTEMLPFGECSYSTRSAMLSREIVYFTVDGMGALPIINPPNPRLVGLVTYVEVLKAIQELC